MCIWTYQGERDERSPREHRVRDESRRWDGPMTLIGRGSETEGEGLPSVLRLDGAVENLVLDGTFVKVRLLLPRRRHVRERVVPSVGARRTGGSLLRGGSLLQVAGRWGTDQGQAY